MRTQERINSINDIIVGIARRSVYKFRTWSVDDLVQELWIKVLDKEEKVGYEIDLNLVARICYDGIVDIQRYDMRRNSYSLDEIIDRYVAEESSDRRQQSSYEENRVFGTKSEKTDNLNRILIDDLLKVFPEGSPERFFLEYHCTATGYRDFGIDGDGKNCGGYTESDLAKKLGYPGTGSYAWKSFKRKMREFVKEYLDL